MSSIAIVFGVLLAALGGGLYSQSQSPTALIPSGFGVALIFCGLLARNEKFRMHAMHFAALIGLVGFVMPLAMVIRKWATSGEFNPLSGGGQLGMAALCGVFLALCVNSFIAARKARKAREQAEAGS
jgi:hypothetical protein